MAAIPTDSVSVPDLKNLQSAVADLPTDSRVPRPVMSATSNPVSVSTPPVATPAATLPGVQAPFIAAAVPQLADVSAAVSSVLAPLPGTDPLAPVESLMTWTVAAAARRDVAVAGAIHPSASTVSSGQAAAVTAVDPTMIATVNVGANPWGVAVSPNGSRAYVNNATDGTVSVIDTASNTTITTIKVGAYPWGVAVSPNGSRAYASASDGTVSVIDTASNTTIKTINVGGNLGKVAVSPDGTRAYVTNQSAGTVSVIDTASNTPIKTIPVGHGPFGVAVSPNGTRVYVTNTSDNSVSVIATTSNATIKTIKVGQNPTAVAVSPNGTRAYVTSGDTVSVIDTTSNTVIKTINAGIPPAFVTPSAVAVSPNGTRAYVANYGDNTVSVIDTTSNTVIKNIKVDAYEGTGVAFSPDGTRAYVTNLATGKVSVIDTGTANVRSTFTKTAEVNNPPQKVEDFWSDLGKGTQLGGYVDKIAKLMHVEIGLASGTLRITSGLQAVHEVVDGILKGDSGEVVHGLAEAGAALKVVPGPAGAILSAGMFIISIFFPSSQEQQEEFLDFRAKCMFNKGLGDVTPGQASKLVDRYTGLSGVANLPIDYAKYHAGDFLGIHVC